MEQGAHCQTLSTYQVTGAVGRQGRSSRGTTNPLPPPSPNLAMSTSFRLPAVSAASGPVSMGRPNRWSAGRPLGVSSDWGPASVGGGRRSGDPNAGLAVAGACGWGARGGSGGGAAAATTATAPATAAPAASLDAGSLALPLPSTAAMAWAGDDAPADGDDDFDIRMTRTCAAECLSPEMAAHLSTASDYLFAKKTRQVRFSSSQLALERPDLSLRPLGRCAWADVLLPLHNGVRMVRWGGGGCA